jgi:hypothetical protein
LIRTPVGLLKLRPAGIEPASTPWKGAILPLNYERIRNPILQKKLQDMGFEPMRFSALRPELSPLTTWVILL